MARFLAFIGLLVALAAGTVAPVHAFPAQRTVALSSRPCGGAALRLEFTTRRFCLGSVSSSDPSAIPGWSFTRASTETCQDSLGNLTTAAVNVPCITDLGLSVWEARTNSFLNSATGVTQSVTTTAASWTLSFYGTGSIALSGGATGSLAGTGANNRVTLTVTATAASTTLTVTGSITKVQFEAGASASPYIPTAGAAATRASAAASIGNFTFPAEGTVLATYVMGLQPTPGPSAFLYGTEFSSLSRFYAQGEAATTPQPSFVVGDGSSNQTLAPLTASSGATLKTAFAYSTLAPKAGAAVSGTDTGDVSKQLTAGTVTGATLYIGTRNGGTNQLNSYLRSLTVAPSFYSAAQRIGATQ